MVNSTLTEVSLREHGVQDMHDGSLGDFRVLELSRRPWPTSYFNSRSKQRSFFHMGSPSTSTFHSCFLFGHLRCEHGLHSPFFQSPFKFIGFRKGPTVLLLLENRDQSIHYSDRDGCGSRCIVPITRTSKRGTPSFQPDPREDLLTLPSLCHSLIAVLI